jgi:hypothetical protein
MQEQTALQASTLRRRKAGQPALEGATAFCCRIEQAVPSGSSPRHYRQALHRCTSTAIEPLTLHAGWLSPCHPAEHNGKRRMSEIASFRMLIGGEWVDASDGKTFESHNPTNGRPWCRVPEATADDVDRAVKAAWRLARKAVGSL